MYMESPLVYRNLNEIISQEHTALVIWDVQNALVNNIFNKVEFLQNIKQLLDAARKKKTPVIYSKITPLPRGYYSSFSLFMQMKRHKVDSPEKLPVFMKQGSFESEIPAEISPRESEVVLHIDRPGSARPGAKDRAARW